jgi:hypothetical protein
MSKRSPSDLARSLLAEKCDREIKVVARQAEVAPDRLLSFLEGGALAPSEMQRLGGVLLTGRYFEKADA